MSNGQAQPRSVVESFLETYLRDRQTGQVRTLRAYLELFGSEELAIASRYLALEQEARDLDLAITANSGVASESFPPRDESGTWIGPYRIEMELGRGGQAVVSLAEDSRLNRKVAVKVLTGWGTLSEEALTRFQREAEVSSRLNHPGICTVYDAGTHNGVPYIVMPYVAGESLRKKLNVFRAHAGASRTVLRLDGDAQDETPAEKPEAPPVARSRDDVFALVHLIEQAARALHFAHEQGVVHRDIKPGNIMVTPDGRPVILDFGLATTSGSHDEGITQSGQLFGTPAYMSPEQLAAQRIPIDRRTDIYSLGVTLYECVTLRLPFEAPTRQALYHAIMTKEPADPRRHQPALPEDLAVVLLTSLEKDRDRRYATALDFAEDLRRVREQEPIKARPLSQRLRLQRWLRRHPRVAPLLAGLILAALVGLVLSVASLRSARSAHAETARVLGEMAQLSDARRLKDLESWADRLWPATPEVVSAPAGMDGWVMEARALLGRREAHVHALEALRARALPRSEDDRIADDDQNRREHPELVTEVERLNLERVHRETGGAGSTEELRRLRNRLADFQLRLTRRRTWRFADPLDTLRHDALSEMVVALEALPGLIASVERRRAHALEVEDQTITSQAALWQEVLAELEDAKRCSPYRPFKMGPQIGLVPLGRDPDSRLFEFAHVQTGGVPERQQATGALRITEDTGLVFVLMPGGMFVMGSAASAEHPAEIPSPRADEGPPHAVELSPFFLSKYEMTQGQWSRIARSNPSYDLPGDTRSRAAISLLHPVEQVSWLDCRRLLEWLQLSLPTEAQWEYACRAGTSTSWATGDEVASLVGYANIADADGEDHYLAGQAHQPGFHDGFESHAPVGSFKPNAFGLHDLHGNVWEWCRDAYGSYVHPVLPGDGLREVPGFRSRVARGGGYFSVAGKARSAARVSLAPSYRNRGLGLRPILSLQP